MSSALTLKAKRRLPTSPLELLASALVLAVMFVIGNWAMVGVVAALVTLFVTMHFSRGTASLTLSEGELTYRTGKITKQLKWNDILQATLKGNRFVGKTIRIRGTGMIHGQSAEQPKSLTFDIPDVFADSIEHVFEMVCVRLPAAAK